MIFVRGEGAKEKALRLSETESDVGRLIVKISDDDIRPEAFALRDAHIRRMR